MGIWGVVAAVSKMFIKKVIQPKFNVRIIDDNSNRKWYTPEIGPFEVYSHIWLKERKIGYNSDTSLRWACYCMNYMSLCAAVTDLAKYILRRGHAA